MAEGSSSKGKEPQRKRLYKAEYSRGGRGGGRGGGGGRGRGRGGGGGRGGGRGGSSRGGAPSGPWDSEGSSKPSHLGRYRDDPLPDIINATGILVTAIQNKERSAEREFVEVMEQVADELYPETSDSGVKEEEQDGDMEAMLQRELNGMSGKERSKRFRLCRHDTPCLLYVQTLAPLDPLRLVEHLLRRIESTARCPLKFVKRVVPLSAVGVATIHQLKTMSEPIIKTGFATEDNRPLKFGVVVNSRNSHKLERLEMIRTVAENVETLGAGHSVDLSNQDRTIIIEVNKNSIGVSVVQDYDRLKKVRGPKHKRAKTVDTDKQYNVAEIAKAAATASSGPGAGAGVEATTAPTEEVQNRAGKVESTEKRKADALEGESGMDVDPTPVEGAAAEEAESDAARAAKQQRI